MATECSRRVVLGVGVAALAGVAGCSEPEPIPDLVVFNDLNETVSVSVELSRSSDGTVVLEDSTSIEADSSVVYDDPVQEAGEYELSVTAGDRSEQYDWTFPEAESRGLQLRIEPDGFALTETGV